MPTKYRGICNSCGKPYLGFGVEFCSRKCAYSSPSFRKRISDTTKGKKKPPFTDKWKMEHSLRMTGSGNPRYGVTCSDETKKKIGDANRNPSEDTRKKQSIAATGRIMSVETKRKISISGKGLKRSAESCRRIGLAQKGKKYSEKTRKKMSESAKKKIFSIEHRKNISIANRGDKNRNWNGGITPLYFKLRGCFEYEQWHFHVFSRDGYKCIECGDDRGGNLHAHHIKFFSDIIKEENIKNLSDISPQSQLWDVKNGKTLCIPCHKRLHKELNRLKKEKPWNILALM